MIDLETAKRIATQEINTHYEGVLGPLVILDGDTIEKGYGWIFFYATQKYAETREFQYALAGNGPLVVEKMNGAIYQLGTAKSVEESIRDYEIRRGFDTAVGGWPSL